MESKRETNELEDDWSDLGMFHEVLAKCLSAAGSASFTSNGSKQPIPFYPVKVVPQMSGPEHMS